MGLQVSATRWARRERFEHNFPRYVSSPPLFAALLLALCLLFAAPASAHYREACWAHFRTIAGWSGTIAATCQYATGAELNEHFRTKKFESHKGYAILVLAGEPPITIRLSEPLRCGFVAEEGCAEQVGHLLTGRDRLARTRHGKWIKREWEVCQPGIMGVCAHQGFAATGCRCSKR